MPSGKKDRSASGALLLFAALLGIGILLAACATVGATPANRVALGKHYGKFLAAKRNNCTTCHLPARHDKPPTSLSEFPHNPFGNRLARAAAELSKAGRKTTIPARLQFIAAEDSDGDGVDNQTELLLGRAPGDPKDRPSARELTRAAQKRAAFANYLAAYRWEPFEPVRRPPVPTVSKRWIIQNPEFKIRNPIDAFLAAEYAARRLRPRPPAPRHILLRRVYLDLVGLSPTPEEIRAFENDRSPNAYEKVVDKLLASPRYGERWGRHWMDVWRYSDWAGWSDGGQIRDSKPHIWRWRDWIVESLNKDKGYDRMVLEMLAADELCPEDTDALRATGFLVRNFKLLSREQWMEDTLNHTSKAFLGVTMHCAKCHDHMYDPITQKEYYRLRALFEPHNVRTDRIPGELNTDKDGLVRAYDADPKVITYFYPRGDERHPDKSAPMEPGVPAALGGRLEIKPVSLPRLAHMPDKRAFVIRDTLAASEKAIEEARKKLSRKDAKPVLSPSAALRIDSAEGAQSKTQEILAAELAVAEARHAALLAVLKAEKLEDEGRKDSETWQQAATEAATAQRRQAMLEAELNLLIARRAQDAAQAKADATAKGMDKAPDPHAKELEAAKKKTEAAEKALKEAKDRLAEPPTTTYKPRPTSDYPAESTGRRLAFARWLIDPQNPLTARVAVNHIWARHFGQGIVPSTSDFGRNGRPPSHPQLLDWLAAEFMTSSAQTLRRSDAQIENRTTQSPDHPITQPPPSWSMKRMHRLIVTSSAYRMASTPDTENLKRDPDNVYLWRMNSRRLEAEAVRDNVLYVSGSLDETMGGPDIDHNQGLTSRRRSIYLRHAAEKQAEFLQIFDGPSVTECYERRPSVMPQQALALANSELAIREARVLARALDRQVGPDNGQFIREAFLRVLARRPTGHELSLCAAFLARSIRARKDAKAQEEVNLTPNTEAVLRARENLALVLFNHNDFVTVR